MNNPAANSKDDKLHICAPFTRSINSVSVISLSEKFFDGRTAAEDLAMSRKDENDGFGDKWVSPMFSLRKLEGRWRQRAEG